MLDGCFKLYKNLIINRRIPDVGGNELMVLSNTCVRLFVNGGKATIYLKIVTISRGGFDSTF